MSSVCASFPPEGGKDAQNKALYISALLLLDMQESEIKRIKEKAKPTLSEKVEYIKYLIEKEQLDFEIKELKEKWGATLVEEIVSDVRASQKKSTPKKYYVSLKEPLEGFGR